MSEKNEISLNDLEKALGGIEYKTAEERTMEIYTRDRNDDLSKMFYERDEELREQRYAESSRIK